MLNREQLEQAIAAQESLRTILGDAVVDATVAILREKLAALDHLNALEQRKLVTILFFSVTLSAQPRFPKNWTPKMFSKSWMGRSKLIPMLLVSSVAPLPV